jgi:hypothetical protein
MLSEMIVSDVTLPRVKEVVLPVDMITVDTVLMMLNPLKVPL